VRNAYVKALYELAEQDDRVCSLIADIGIFVFDKFKEDFPGRFFNVGIAESNMVGVAAGLALCDKIPFIYTIIPFVTARCLDPIRIDVCYQNLNVKIVGVGSGFTYGILGATHHAIEDIAIMRAMPNMAVISPADPSETARATKAAAEREGPVYIRLSRPGGPVIHHRDYRFEIGKAIVLRNGHDATIISTGEVTSIALEAAESLSKENMDIRVIDMHTIKPIDKAVVLSAAEETKAIVTLEEHSIIGGLGSAVAEVLAEEAPGKALFGRIGIRDRFCTVAGSQEYLQNINGLSVVSIVNSVNRLLYRGAHSTAEKVV